MTRCEVREATHVKTADGAVERIASKWGINDNGSLAKPSEGGFGVWTDTGKRVTMFEAHFVLARVMKKDPNIKRVSAAEAEAADYVVCMRVGSPSPFDDNLTGVCSLCGHGIIFRPHVPKTPPKICVECLLTRLKGPLH